MLFTDGVVEIDLGRNASLWNIVIEIDTKASLENVQAKLFISSTDAKHSALNNSHPCSFLAQSDFGFEFDCQDMTARYLSVELQDFLEG